MLPGGVYRVEGWGLRVMAGRRGEYRAIWRKEGEQQCKYMKYHIQYIGQYAGNPATFAPFSLKEEGGGGVR